MQCAHGLVAMAEGRVSRQFSSTSRAVLSGAWRAEGGGPAGLGAWGLLGWPARASPSPIFLGAHRPASDSRPPKYVLIIRGSGSMVPDLITA
jgi:hypothetical protein